MFISEENDPESPSKSSTATIVAVVAVLVILLIVVVGIVVWRLRSPRNGMFWFIPKFSYIIHGVFIYMALAYACDVSISRHNSTALQAEVASFFAITSIVRKITVF